MVRCDRGTEFTSIAVDYWAYFNHVVLDFRRPATPTDNAAVESFNASLRRQCLSHTRFTSSGEVEQVLDTWRTDYNNVRSHTSFGHRSRAEFRAIVSLPPAILIGRKRAHWGDLARYG